MKTRRSNGIRGTLLACAVSGVLAAAPDALANGLPTNSHSQAIAERTAPVLEHVLERKGMHYGTPVYIRIFKLHKSLEVWLEGDDGEYKLFDTYRICAYSGALGPKIRQGDLQSPEGFYTIQPRSLNPNSQFHLSFDIGFPNAYDRAHGRTGNFLMVHGSCVSVGCYAMTDRRMEEIYTLAFAALEGGQYEIPIHIFPFKMTDANMRSARRSQWYSFWQNMKEGYDMFEQTKVPPMVWAENGTYAFHKRGPRLHHLLAFGTAPKPSIRPGWIPSLHDMRAITERTEIRTRTEPRKPAKAGLLPFGLFHKKPKESPLDATAGDKAVEALKRPPEESAPEPGETKASEPPEPGASEDAKEPAGPETGDGSEAPETKGASQEDE